MKTWLLFTLAFGWVSLYSHAAEVEFRSVFVASPMPIRTGSAKLSHQPGLVTTLTPSAQKTLIEDLLKSTPTPDLVTLPSVTSKLQLKAVINLDRDLSAASTSEILPQNPAPGQPAKPPGTFSAQVECEAQSITDSRITVILRPQATTRLRPTVIEPQVVTVPISTSSAEPLVLPPAHTDALVLRALVNTDLSSGDWALIYLGKTSEEVGLPHYLYAFVSATVVK